MDDLFGLLVFLVIGAISIISKNREDKAASPPLPRKKIKSQSLNRRPIKQSKAIGRKLDNEFQQNLSAVDELGHEEHAVFEHEHQFDEEKTEAVVATAAQVEYGTTRANNFAHFIQDEGQNAIVLGEILGRPKGWE